MQDTLTTTNADAGADAERCRTRARSAPRSIGWIGLGALGLASAQRAIACGWEVWGCESSDERGEAARAAGVHLVADPRAAADHADQLVVCCVRDARQVDHVLFGTGGALRSSPDRVGLVLSSISVEAMVSLGERAQAAGTTVIAVPVLGNSASAVAGESLFVVSGEPSGRVAAAPLLADLGRAVVDLGDDPGAAQGMKLISQLVQIVGMLATLEGVDLGARLGLDPGDVRRVLAATEPSWTTDHWNYAVDLWRRGDPATSLGLFAKDLDAAVDSARSLDLSLPVLTAAQRRLADRLDTIDNLNYQSSDGG